MYYIVIFLTNYIDILWWLGNRLLHNVAAQRVAGLVHLPDQTMERELTQGVRSGHPRSILFLTD